MGRITRLPDDLANQIAAGEVVERPASVVKELVENAIDAGARRIAIHVELGGKKQVRVEDDGEGMDPDDARLALERHATSKIRRADDLAAILTHGFRGDSDSPIQLTLEQTGGGVRLTYEDSAPRHDPIASGLRTDIDATVNMRQVGGLGVAIALGLTQDATYAYVDGRNRVTMTYLTQKTQG